MSVVLAPWQTVLLPETDAVMEPVFTVIDEVPEQIPEETVTEYVVEVVGVTMMDEVVAPVFNK